MKKSLSLVLAAVLAFGGAVSAFAWPTSGDMTAPAKIGDTTGGLYPAYTWSSDDGYFTSMAAAKGVETLKYGTTFGFIITDGNGLTGIATKADHVKNLRAYPEYNMTDSKNLVEKVNIEYKKFDTEVVAPGASNTTKSYAYFVTMKTKANATASAADLMGTMRIGKSSTDAKTPGRGFVEFGFTLDNNKAGADTGNGSSYTVTGSTKVLDFNNQGDIDITFTSTTGNDQATFTVDATGQSKLNCGYSIKFNSEFAAKYPAANLEFISWAANPSFNRIGELQIYADPDTYLYQLTEDGFKEVNAQYDETYEAYVIKTRTLGSYVVSDIELEAEVIDEVPVSSAPGTNPPTGGVVEVPNNGGKPNPNTGR